MIRLLRGQRGTSTLEFVVVLPMLLFILFAIVELSRAWLTLNLVTTAAREGVRAGTVAGETEFPDPPTAMARINEILAAEHTASVTCSTNPCAADSTVQATVSVQFSTLVPLILPMLGGDQAMTIQQTARMRYE